MTVAGGAEFSSFCSFYLSSFLYPFLSFLYLSLSTSLHSALSGVDSGARCAITEGLRPVMMINQLLSTYVCTLPAVYSTDYIYIYI